MLSLACGLAADTCCPRRVHHVHLCSYVLDDRISVLFTGGAIAVRHVHSNAHAHTRGIVGSHTGAEPSRVLLMLYFPVFRHNLDCAWWYIGSSAFVA